MKRHSNFRLTRLKEAMYKVLQQPKAKDIENRYKTIAYALSQANPLTARLLSPTELVELTEDILYLDREQRFITKLYDKEEKERRSKEWQLSNGYIPHYTDDVKKLNTL